MATKKSETTKTQGTLTAAQLAAMADVRNGADVYAYGAAVLLREVQRAHPELIDICPAMNPPANGAERQPYFGAILTAAGRDALDLALTEVR